MVSTVPESIGRLDISNIILVDTLTDGSSNTLSLNASPTFVTASSGSTSTTVKPNGSITYSASYTIQTSAYNSGSIKNTVTVTGSSPGNSNDVSDVSDDGDDSDGNTTDDPTVLYIGDLPSFKVEKTGEYIDDNGTAGLNEGDTVKFTIKIINTGADVITLDSNYTDVMYNGFNVPITPPSLVLESQTENNENTAQPYD